LRKTPTLCFIARKQNNDLGILYFTKEFLITLFTGLLKGLRIEISLGLRMSTGTTWLYPS